MIPPPAPGKTLLTEAVGLKEGISRHRYNAIDALNYSSMKYLLESPLHMKSRATFVPTDATDFGNILDAIMCNDKEVFVVSPYDNFRTKMAQEWRDKVRNDGFIIADPIDVEACVRIHRSMMEHPKTGKVLSTAKKQLCIVGMLNNVAVKGLADLVVIQGKKCMIADLKTTNDISDHAWQNKVFSMDYHVQAATYTALMEANGYEVVSYKWLLAENCKPYDWRWVTFNKDDLEFSKKIVAQAVDLYRQCRAANTWPGYDKDTSTVISLPAFAKPNLGSD